MQSPMEAAPEWYCSSCAEVTAFVQPPCVDGHTDDGGECPEWACAECGSAVLAGNLDVGVEVSRSRRAA